MTKRIKLTKRKKTEVAVMVESSSCMLVRAAMNRVKFTWRKIEAMIVSLAALVTSSGWSCFAV